MRVSYKPSPWGMAGGLAGGLAEGLYMGGSLANQRGQLALQQKQMEQQGELHKSAQYFKMLEAAVKAGEVAPEVANALLQMAAQQGGAPGARASIPPFPSIDEQQQRKIAQIDAIIKNPNLSPEQRDAHLQMMGIKSPKEMMDFTLPDGRTVRLSAEKGAPLMQQAMLKEIALAAKGGGKGGGGGGKDKISNWVNWHMPDGSIVQAPYNQKPQGATYFTKTGTSDPYAKDAPQERPFGDKIKILQAQENVRVAMASGKPPSMTDVLTLQAAGSGGIGPQGFPVPPSTTKPPKKKGATQAPPTKMYEAPPPPDEEE
jgi:hypothetical protein